MADYVLNPQLNTSPVAELASGATVLLNQLPLSDRLVVALEDWHDYYRESSADLGDEEVRDAFTSQAYKLAHAMRRELKGHRIYLQLDDELVAIRKS